ncbi:flavodoxin domain-containing protein [Salibaculum sp.]|uniref:flavodoxin domain-containing protein n=1 Tax=Salibaculum sp. TaxID=2855480 RepID=UPI002B4A0AD4|nr:flavodoxin domain-containing protein [Salibaculum sp.]HKL68675.1 flavodoxin domain-containing protein [Salibaculum sp.]
MTVPILFQSLEGQTRKIADFAADQVREAGKTPRLIDMSDPMVEVPLDDAEKVILAAPVHERRHPQEFELFLTASKSDLERCKTLLLSVSMNAAFPEGRAEAQDYLTEMQMRTGFTPDASALVAGAVQTPKYDYFATQVIQHVVLKGKDFDAEAAEHEFTDWDALRSTLSAFLA